MLLVATMNSRWRVQQWYTRFILPPSTFQVSRDDHCVANFAILFLDDEIRNRGGQQSHETNGTTQHHATPPVREAPVTHEPLLERIKFWCALWGLWGHCIDS